MKSFAIAALVVSGWAAPAMACNPDILTVTDWQAIENEGDNFLPYRLEATVTYNGEKPYRMIHAGVMFADVLGESLGQVNLPRDAVVQPGEAVVADRQTGSKERIGTIAEEDIVHRTCVWSVVYEDGTVDQF